MSAPTTDQPLTEPAQQTGQGVGGKQWLEVWQDSTKCDYGWFIAQPQEDGRLILMANGKKLFLQEETVALLRDWLSTTPSVSP